MSAKNVFRGIAHTLEAVTSECGEFKRAWSDRLRTDDFPRLWEGEWKSETNHHHGRLRCVLRKKGNQTLEAFFQAKYSRFLRACYRVNLSVSKSDERLHLIGSADLGALAGGLYEYRGILADQEFTCRYRCEYDAGEFRLRPHLL